MIYFRNKLNDLDFIKKLFLNNEITLKFVCFVV